MNDKRNHPGGFDRKARSKVAANVGISVALAFALLVLGNLGVVEIARRHDVRVDMTRDGFHTLSDETKRLARGLEDDIDVYIVHGADDPVRNAARAQHFANTPDSGILNGEYLPLIQSMAMLLASVVQEINHVNPRIRIRVAGTDEEITTRWRSRLGLSREELVNHIVFHNASRRSTKAISFYRAFQFEMGGPRANLPRVRPRIRGELIEPAVLHGLKTVSTRRNNIVYHTVGHGEIDLPGVETVLQSENFVLKKVDLTSAGAVPEDADLLIISTATREWTKPSRLAVRKYLESGGRILLVQGRMSRERFDDLLEPFGLSLKSSQIEHGGAHQAGRPRSDLFGRSFLSPAKGTQPHTIAAALVEQHFPVYLGAFRCYDSNDDYDRERVKRQIILHSGKDAEAVPLVWNGREPVRRPDLRVVVGDFPMMAAIEIRGQEPGKDTQSVGRLVCVAGDQWLGLRQLSLGTTILANRDLLMGAVNWLTDNESLITTTPRAYRGNVAALDPTEARTFRFLTVFVLPALMALTGILVFLLRRR